MSVCRHLLDAAGYRFKPQPVIHLFLASRVINSVEAFNAALDTRLLNIANRAILIILGPLPPVILVRLSKGLTISDGCAKISVFVFPSTYNTK
jgi:hypothetical protein